ncbi:MAG: hypothetical protein PHN82_02345 [bacterium]|nr:hypothetical protein [bacterium]
MGAPQRTAGRLDAALAVAVRVLLALVIVLFAGWAGGLRGGAGRAAGTAAGCAVAALVLLMERRILSACRRHAGPLALAAALLYVALLGAAAVSELLDLGWFDWLGI